MVIGLLRAPGWRVKVSWMAMQCVCVEMRVSADVATNGCGTWPFRLAPLRRLVGGVQEVRVCFQKLQA